MKPISIDRALRQLHDLIGPSCRVVIAFEDGKPKIDGAFSGELESQVREKEDQPKIVPERWQEHKHDQRYFG